MTAPHGEAQKDQAGEQRLDVVVVGGSQAGLAMAWHLAQQGRRFVVLEAAPELGHTWRSRWDSLKLFTPAQYDALPGMAFPAPADTYPTKDPVAGYLQAYAKAFDLPVQLNAKVTELRRLDDGSFEVRAADATYRARQVVVATGPFQVPFVPPPAAKLDASVAQVHSADYRNPQTLPEGPVLVVGGGNSGFQIAEELAATRTVDLSIATTYPMLPQRRAGRDLFWWLTRLGLRLLVARSGDRLCAVADSDRGGLRRPRGRGWTPDRDRCRGRDRRSLYDRCRGGHHRTGVARSARVGILASQWRAARVSLLARARTCSASSGGSRISNSAPRMAT
jgi:cation diffusion facilitator CzcD-associated flavoprotein CzcO